VLFPREAQIKAASAGESRFAMDGTIYEDSTGIKVTAYMTDTKTGKQIWGDAHRSNVEAVQFLALFQTLGLILVFLKPAMHVRIWVIRPFKFHKIH